MKTITLACLLSLTALTSTMTIAEGETTTQQVVQNTASLSTIANSTVGNANVNTNNSTVQRIPDTTNPVTTTNNGNSTTQNTAKPIDITAQNMAINPYANPNSIATVALPTNNQLVTANQELLTNNVALQRQVNDLETQVNVLVNERSGQLFMYGALTAIGAMLLGLLIAWILFGRRERW